MKKKEYAALTSFLYRKYVDFYKKEGKEAYDAQVKNPQSALNRDIEKAMEPMFTTGDAEERAGLGFAVMQSFMDKVKVSSTPGRGTRVTLTKRLEART